MKNENYRLIISSENVYEELLLNRESEKIRIGTTTNCGMRFKRENYGEDFEIELNKANNEWQISCSESICLMTNSLFMEKSRFLKPGDIISIRFCNCSEKLVEIAFLLDFGTKKSFFDGYIDISGIPTLSIGKKDYCNIIIQDDYVGNDEFHIIQDAEGIKLQIIDADNGIFLNGFQMSRGIRKIEGKDFITICGHEFFLSGCELYAEDVQNMDFKGIHFIEERENLEYPFFHRTTRVKSVFPEQKIEILAPKVIEKKPERNLLLSLIPLAISLVLMIAIRMVMSNGGVFVIYSAATMGIGIFTSILTYRNDGKEYRNNVKEREKQYLQYLDQIEKNVRLLRKKEIDILNETYISLEEAVQRVETFDARLFERSILDEDFLAVRLGTGTIDFRTKIAYKEPDYKETEDKLMDYPAMIAEKYKDINDAPICIDLKQVHAVGFVGNEKACYQMLKNVTLDLAVRHQYRDVKFVYFLPKEMQDTYLWLRWLKNVEYGGKRNIVYDEKSRKYALEELYSLFSFRETLKRDERQELTHYVVFVCGDHEIFKHPVSRYVEKCKDYGVTFLFFENKINYLPKGCGKIIILNDKALEGIIINSDNQEKRVDFKYTIVSEEDTRNVALRLGSIEMDEISLDGGLTKHVSLFELLNIVTAEDINLKKYWDNARIYESMAAPLGLKKGNEIVYLDLNEKKHGPHGLVAGTTGSGKSEILLSYILSLSIKFHPFDVGFVIIDFKGGGMANQLKDLPHLISTITNIDGRELDRSLLSLKAELHRRQKLFAQYEVNHIDDYIRKFKSGQTKIALPHLVLIVDEFAELKSGHPEFMQELISAARIGRSLGVHLILATQKPAGVVNEQIWSNSKFKLCLKVQNKSDSNEVLKSPLAAEIRESGRAYLQVGNNEIFELFQSAYSGEAADIMQLEKVHEYKVYEIAPDGRKSLIYEKKQRKMKANQTQLEAVVNHIQRFCQDNGIGKLPGICLPSLPEIIPFKMEKTNQTENVLVPFGISDQPEKQVQKIVHANFTKENIFVIGSSQYGKTNFISALIKGIATAYSPKQVNIYILDFASMALKIFEKLNHVGGVITSAEDEKLFNFFKMMEEEIKRRKEILAEAGLSSYAAYLEAGYSELPQIVIMVDNLTVLKELYLQENDRLLPICREGIAVGVSVVITNSQSSGIGFRYLSNFAKRIGFYCNNSSEYHALFEHCRIEPLKVPGRGILEIEKNIYEFQSYLAFSGEKEVERVAKMREFIQEVNQLYPDQCAKPIPLIPKKLTEKIINKYAEKKQDAVVIGLDYETVAPVYLDITKTGNIGFLGRDELGKNKFLQYLFIVMEQYVQGVELYVMDDALHTLQYLQQKSITKFYTTESESILSILEEFVSAISSRKEHFSESRKMEPVPMKLLLIQDYNILNEIQKNKEQLEQYKMIVEQGTVLRMGVWITNLPNTPIVFSSPEPVKILRDKRQMLLFENLSEQKLLDIPISLIRNTKKNLGFGDAYYVIGGETKKLKTVVLEES